MSMGWADGSDWMHDIIEFIVSSIDLCDNDFKVSIENSIIYQMLDFTSSMNWWN